MACIIKLREVMRNLSAIQEFKKSHDGGQEQNTRSQSQIDSYKRIRDALIQDYNRHRDALIRLNAVAEDSSEFRKLEVEDTVRKSTTTKRSIGDAHRRDGYLWRASADLGTMTSIASTSNQQQASVSEDGESGSEEPPMKRMRYGTSQHRRKKAQSTRGSATSKPKVQLARPLTKPEDGWIWTKAIMGQTDDMWSEQRK